MCVCEYGRVDSKRRRSFHITRHQDVELHEPKRPENMNVCLLHMRLHLNQGQSKIGSSNFQSRCLCRTKMPLEKVMKGVNLKRSLGPSDPVTNHGLGKYESV